MKKAFVWRETVYKTGKCPECGALVYNIKKNEPDANTMIDLKMGRCYCGNCGFFVAVIKDYNGSESGRLGKWNGEL